MADLATAPHTVSGSCTPRFERVREEFERNFAERGESGASVCVILDGEPVVDLWGGVADEAIGRPWEQDTMNVIFSCSKGLAALCGNMLIDRGLLDLDAPIARYWPEFAQKGKAEIPVRMAFNHQSGVFHVDEIVPPGGFNDWDAMIGRIERTRPAWEPGTRAGYHGLTIGWLIGELVRRIDGRSIGTFFHNEVADPLGLDAWIGLPAVHEHRVAKSMSFDPGLPDPPDWLPVALTNPSTRSFQAIARAIMRTPPLRRAVTRRIADLFEERGLPPELAADAAKLDSLMFRLFANLGDWLPSGFDTPAAHAAEIPAGGAIANARGLAGAYAPLSLGGVHNGVRIVSESAIAGMRYPQSNLGRDAVLGIATSYTLGFSKSWPNFGREGDGVIIGEDAFGTPGLGGQIGFADPSYRLAFAYTMTKHGIGTGLNERGQSLVDATYATLGSAGCARGFWIRPAG
jgi:CubicO group peptidase (beta-lactamase class C family)